MKKRCLFLLSTILCVSFPALADDTAIYGVSTIDLKPNVLILFDNSGSMSTKDVGTSNRSRMIVAKEVVAKLIDDNIADVDFGVMKFNAGTPNSYHGGTYDKRHESGFLVAKCGATKSDLLGTYHQHDPNVSGDPPTTTFSDSNQTGFGVIGNMRSGGYTPLAETAVEAGLYFAGKTSWYNGQTKTGFPTGGFSAACTKSTSAAPHSTCQDYSDDTPIEWRCQKNYLIVMTDGAPTRDQNARMKTNAYIYSNIKIPDAKKDGSQDYLDDIAYFLHEYDIRVLPANPTAKQKLAMGTSGDYFEKQTVTTYTIGFKSSQTLLQNTANNGGGKYYTASDADSLSTALNSIITKIKDDNATFAAAAVPVSRTNNAYAGNSVYYGLFKPVTGANWLGNIKKYFITDMGVIKQWCSAEDKTCNDAINMGEIVANSKSYWLTGTTPDEQYVNKGGAGGKLLSDINAGTSRKIYTYTNQKDTNGKKIRKLTENANQFTVANTLLTASALGAADSAARTTIIDAVRHEDNTWALGSFLHSTPLVTHYTKNNGSFDRTLIFAGANDGMLHAINDTDGSENWAYIPKDLQSRMGELVAPSTLKYFVDGTPVLYSYDHDLDSTTKDKKLMIFGERRGGTSYTTLDITKYDIPKFKYTITKRLLQTKTNGIWTGELLGQSWFTPQLSTMGYDDSGTYKTKDAFLMTGGYDTNQDKSTPSSTDGKGRAVFAIDAIKGNLLTNFNFNHSNFNLMTHSIIDANAFENPKSRTITRAYAGDMNGNLFAFRDDIYDHHQDKNNPPADTLYDGKEDGVWGQNLRLFQSAGKKIFYAPNIVNDYFTVNILQKDHTTIEKEQRVGDYVFYGTGDRANPERKDIKNSFYAIKNSWDWGTNATTTDITEAYIKKTDGKLYKSSDDTLLANGKLFILDVTDDLYQNNDPDAAKRKLYFDYVVNAMNDSDNRGWFINFVDDNGKKVGEKMVSTPIIFGGVIYFTTYVPAPPPDPNAVVDKCADPGAQGNGYLYAIGYKYGDASIDYETDPNDPGGLRKKDRKKKLKIPGIPPQPVLAIHEGKPTLITGFETNDPKFTQGLNRFYWRQINR